MGKIVGTTGTILGTSGTMVGHQWQKKIRHHFERKWGTNGKMVRNQWTNGGGPWVK